MFLSFEFEVDIDAMVKEQARAILVVLLDLLKQAL